MRASQIRDHANQESKALIAIHAETQPRKQWAQERWREVCYLLGNYALFIQLGRPEQQAIDAPGLLPPPGTWTEQAAVLAKVDAFVGIDSSWAHVADSFALPGAVLFGPTAKEIDQWRPINSRLVVLLAPDGDLQKIYPAELARILKSTLSPADERAGPSQPST
jgi:ADP-heptose:LPS heptosyltransferase